MSVKPEGLLGEIKKLMFCIIQCKLKIFNSILIFTFNIIIKDAVQSYNQSRLLPFKMIYFICNGGVGTAI